MSPGFSSEFKELVRGRTDLAQLVGESISLKPLRGGSDYVGLCPFHDDHNPSFHIYPDRQSYRCWVCDEMGDCFSFVMKIDGVGFREALEMLATRAGLEIPKNYGSAGLAAGRQAGEEKSDLYKVLAWAENEFHRCLLSSPGALAREYLQGRGFTQETIREFKLGYHPNDFEWLQGRARGSFTPEQLFAARLVKQSDRGNGYYDDFVDRVLFPIRDIRARTVAFGGRILPGDERPNTGKYINSADSKLFTKSDLLYGFDAARDAIRRSETAVVVEGYTDCIIAHQHGVRNVVATLGTALTESHVGSLKRLARRVVQCFDGDEAGRKAVDRSLVKFVAQDVELKILTLPGGADPAEFLAEHGPEEFQRLIDGAVELWEHKLKLTFERFGFDSPKAREDIVSEMVGLLAQAPRLSGTPREHLLLSRLSQRVGLPEQSVRQQLAEARHKASRRPASPVRVDSAKPPADGARLVGSSKSDRIETELLEVVFAEPSTLAVIRQQVAVDEIGNAALRKLLQLCYELSEQGREATFDRLMSALEDPEQKRLAQRIDELARSKQIGMKLREGEQSADPAGRSYLEQVIENLQWQRQKRSHETAKGQIAQQLSAGEREGDRKAQFDALSQVQAFHAKRAAQQRLK